MKQLLILQEWECVVMKEAVYIQNNLNQIQI